MRVLKPITALAGFAVLTCLYGCAHTMSEAERVRATITAAPYSIKALKDGVDIGERWPVKTIRYQADGSALGTLADGREIKSTWKLDEQGRTMTLTTPGAGESRWQLLEVGKSVFRKRNLDNGIETVQTPR